MSLPISDTLLGRWYVGEHVGEARPTMQVQVRPGHFERGYATDGHWRAAWTPDDDYIDLPNVASFDLEQSFDSNGIAVGTFEVDNVAFRDRSGPGGSYHTRERGWFSPLRSYRPRGRPGSNKTANEYDRLLDTTAQIDVVQGYGDETITTFNGLLDSAAVTPLPDKIMLTARDNGGVLADSKLFGWNIDPKLRDPLTFHPLEKVKRWERSGDAYKRKQAASWRKNGIVIDDVADMVTTVLRWAGFPPESHRVSPTGAPLRDKIQFGATDTYATVIQKACDLTGYQFFIGGPEDGATRGRPTFRRSRAAIAYPTVAYELRDDQLLTGLNWNTTSEPKASIYRVRGKTLSEDRGGRLLGHWRTPAILGIYRPPWHRRPDGTGSDRDGRVLKHVIAEQPLYTTQKEVDVAAMLWALASALASTTANLELPTNPALQLDDVIGAYDAMAGMSSRCWIASRSESFKSGRETSWTQTLGVALLDTPDVVGVVDDLHARLTGLPRRGLA